MAVDLSRRLGVPHISTGDLFRQHIRQKTELGLKASSYIESGLLVPDELTLAMVEDRLNQPDSAGGFVLDGFPRTLPQAEALATILSLRDRPLDAVINIRVADETIIRRLSGRWICPTCGKGYNLNHETMRPRNAGTCDECGSALIQRADDQPATIQTRLSTYSRQTEPLIRHYRQQGLIITVDNEGEPDESLNAALAALADTDRQQADVDQPLTDAERRQTDTERRQTDTEQRQTDADQPLTDADQPGCR